MKKAIMFIGMMMLSVALVACGKDDQKESVETQESQMEQETTQEVESSVVEEESSVEESTEDADSMIDLSNGWSDTMQALKQSVVDELGDNYWPSMMITPDLLEGIYGVTSDMYYDYMAEMPMISTNVDTLIVIWAKEGKVQEVEDALNAYRDVLVNDTMQYPMNLGKIQASMVETVGDFVCFIQLGADTMDLVDEGDDAVIEHCEKENKRVLGILKKGFQILNQH